MDKYGLVKAVTQKLMRILKNLLFLGFLELTLIMLKKTVKDYDTSLVDLSKDYLILD